MLYQAAGKERIQQVEIGSIVTSVATTNPTVTFADDEFVYVDLSAVDQDQKAVTGARQVLGTDAPSRARQVVRHGDVLVSTVRPNLNGVALVPPELDQVIASTGFCVLRPNPRRIDSRYLFHWVRTPSFVTEMVKQATGASYPAVSDGIVRRSKIPLVPLEEQRRIAAILDEADALRAKRRAALAHLDEMARAIFVEMFGDALSNSAGWPEQRCAALCKRITVGVVVRPASYYKTSGIPAIRGTNIKADGIDMTDAVYFSAHDNENVLSKSRVWKDDVVIVRTGRPGLAAIIPECLDGANAIDIIIATPDREKVRSRFLCELLNSDAGRAITLAESKGQIQQHFNVGSFSDAQIMVPSLDLQIAFEKRIDELMCLRQSYSASAANQDSLFASLQHRAFRGEL